MTDRPIIFSGPMVRALLAGRKTQTRRIVRDVPAMPSFDNLKGEPRHDAPYLDAYCGERKTAANPRGMSNQWAWWTRDDRPGQLFRVPAAPGDRLYVREAFRMPDAFDDKSPAEAATIVDPTHGPNRFFEADGAVRSAGSYTGKPGKLRPSIHMPRWASRLTLIVESVRVEPLQALEGQHPLESDAIAEGVHRIHHGDGDYYYHAFRDEPHPQNWADPADAFRDLWESLHGAGSWDTNPFVVALTFRVERKNIDRLAA